MSESFLCPNCAAEIAPDESGKLPPRCAACGEMLIVDDEDEPRDDAAAGSTAPAGDTGEMEELRIRRIVRERRAQVRTRSYYIVVMLACIVLAAQLVVRLIPALKAGNTRESIGWAAGALLLLVIAWSLVARVRQLTHEINTSALPSDTPPPTFEGLSDGSQHQRNLEEMDGQDGK